MRRPFASTTLTVPAGMSSARATATIDAMMGLVRSETSDMRRDHLLQARGRTRIAGLLEDFLEETFDDEPRCGIRIHAAAAEIEKLFVVDRPDGRAVRAARDVVDEDLELRFGVGSSAFRQQQVAVRLICLAPRRVLADRDDAGVGRVRAVVERALEKQIATRIGSAMALQRMEVELLVVLAEDKPKHVALCALTDKLDFDVAARHARAHREVQRDELRVSSDACVLMRKCDAVGGLVLYVHVGEMCALADDEVDDAGRERGQRLFVPLDDGRARAAIDRNVQPRIRTTIPFDDDGSGQLNAGWHDDMASAAPRGLS